MNISKYRALLGLLSLASLAQAGCGGGWNSFGSSFVGSFAGSAFANAVTAPRERTVVVERPVVERVVERPRYTYVANDSRQEQRELERQQAAIQKTQDNRTRELQTELELQKERNRELELKTKQLALENEQLRLQADNLKQTTEAVPKKALIRENNASKKPLISEKEI